MKKTLTTFAIVLLVCVASIFAFTACGLDNITIEGDGNWEITADNKAHSIEVVNGFFEDTLKDPNVVVTVKRDGKVVFTENVKGTDSSYVTDTGVKVYAYKKGDAYYYAYESVNGEDVSRYHQEGEEAKTYYDQNYCFFMTYIKAIAEAPEEGATFTASNVGEDHDSISKDEQKTTSTADLTFNYTGADGSTAKITAKAKDDLVQTATFESKSADESEGTFSITMTFAYGSAVVTLPDTDAWNREDAAKSSDTTDENDSTDENE